jgi:SAM-dependent methyltransferase
MTNQCVPHAYHEIHLQVVAYIRAASSEEFLVMPRVGPNYRPGITRIKKGAAGAVQRAASANRRISQAWERSLHIESDKPFWRGFDRQVADAVGRLTEGAIVLDVGGGRRCAFADAVPRGRGVRLLAVDISPEELAANTVADERRVGDVRELPLRDSEVDLIVSRTLLEHVDGVSKAVEEIVRVLKPGAMTLHLVPGRYSLFATAARILPFEPLLGLLHLAYPASRDEIKFPVHYDNCHPVAMERLFRRAGCSEVTVTVCYAQNGYFTAVFPAFILVCLYQALVRRLQLRVLAAYMIVTARR